MAVTLTSGILSAVLSFVVLTIATYLSSGVFTGGLNLGYSAVTAAITSIVWFAVTFFISGVVGIGGVVLALGPVLAIIAYVLVVDLRYEGGIIRASGIAVGTWLLAFAILYVAALFGYSSFQAIGVPPGI